MSDGVGNPLSYGPDVRAALAQWWARPPDPFTFAAQVGFAKRTHIDDRTAVGIWSVHDAGQREEPGNPKLISEGGFGKVYRLEDYQLPGDPTPLAYKEFTTDVAEQARGAERAVDFRDAMSPGVQALDLVAVWPRALVVNQGGTVIGLLMPLIPKDFFFPGN